jgi:hypothetical protein
MKNRESNFSDEDEFIDASDEMMPEESMKDA